MNFLDIFVHLGIIWSLFLIIGRGRISGSLGMRFNWGCFFGTSAFWLFSIISGSQLHGHFGMGMFAFLFVSAVDIILEMCIMKC